MLYPLALTAEGTKITTISRKVIWQNSQTLYKSQNAELICIKYFYYFIKVILNFDVYDNFMIELLLFAVLKKHL